MSDASLYGDDWGPARETAAKLGFPDVSKVDSCNDPKIFGCAAWWVLQNREHLPRFLAYWKRVMHIDGVNYAAEFRNEGFTFPPEIRDDEKMRFIFQIVMIAFRLLAPSA